MPGCWPSRSRSTWTRSSGPPARRPPPRRARALRPGTATLPAHQPLPAPRPRLRANRTSQSRAPRESPSTGSDRLAVARVVGNSVCRLLPFPCYSWLCFSLLASRQLAGDWSAETAPRGWCCGNSASSAAQVWTAETNLVVRQSCSFFLSFILSRPFVV